MVTRGRSFPNSGLETLPAAAGTVSARVFDFESTAGHGIAEINGGTAQVIGAERIHDDANAKEIDREILGPLVIEHHTVLHPRAAAGFDINPEAFAAVFRIAIAHGGDFPGGWFRQKDGSIRWRRGGGRSRFSHSTHSPAILSTDGGKSNRTELV